MLQSNELIWNLFDRFHTDFPNDTYDESIASMEKFNPARFYRENHVFRIGHFGARIVGLGPKTELPTGAILHILDDAAYPNEHQDTPRIEDNVFVQRESFRRFIFHVRDFNLNGPIMMEDKYVYRQSGLPSMLMRFRSKYGSFFKYVNSIAEMPTKKECLVLVNHNPLFRARLFGRMQFFRKTQLILASILNTVHQLTSLNKQQYILIPWGEEVYDKQMFTRSRIQLNMATVKRPESFHYIVMMHLMNFMWDKATTSIFDQLPEEDLRQINIILQLNNKYVFYNLQDLKDLNVKNKAYFRFANQLNLLSILGRVTDSTPEEIKKVIDTHFEQTSEKEEKQEAGSVVDTNVVETEYEPKVDVDSKVDTEETVEEKVEAVINKVAPIVPLSKLKPITTSVSTEIPQVDPIVREVHDSATVEVKGTQQINSTSIKTPSENTDAFALEFLETNEQEADTFIEEREDLTPKEKERYKMLSRKYKNLELDGERLEDILLHNNDLSLEEDVLNEKVVGYVPDPSALKSSLVRFDENYMKKTFNKHLVGVVTSFQKNGVYLTGIKSEKIVTEMNNVTQYTLKYEDIEKRQSTIKFRIPTVDKEGKVLIDGVKQVLKKQRVNLPIVKISDTEVSLASNQNKTRVERNINKAHNYFAFIDSMVNSPKSHASIEFGSCRVNLPLSYEYSSLAERYKGITFSTDTEKWELYFDYVSRLEHFGSTKEKLESLEQEYGVYFGRTKQNWLFIDNQNIVRAVAQVGGEAIDFEYSSIYQILRESLREGESFTKSLTEWVSIKILDKQLPVIFVLAYRYGLRNILDYIGIRYTITERRSRTIVGEGGFASFGGNSDTVIGVGDEIIQGDNWIKIAGQESLEEIGFSPVKGDWVYHISVDDHGPELEAKMRKMKNRYSFEMKNTPHMCVCDSVLGCTIAVNSITNRLDKSKKKSYMDAYVYAIRKDELPEDGFISNETIVEKKWVFDAHITDEAWITKPVVLKKVGKIAVAGTSPETVDIFFKPIRAEKTMEREGWTIGKTGYMQTFASSYSWIEGKDPAGGPKYFDIHKHYDASIYALESFEIDTDQDTDQSPISEDQKYKPKLNDIAIKFADRILWFNRYPLAHSLLVAGLDYFDLSSYELAEFESKDIYYQLLLDKRFSHNLLKGIDAFYDLFIDNMTFTTLKMMKEPTNVRDLLIRCAVLLSTLDYRPPSSRQNHRIRGYEQFNAILYNEMARQFATYKSHRGKANVFSINPDAVFLRIIQNASMVPSESANPLQDIKEMSYMTYSGVGGRTSDSFVVNDRKLASDDIGVISEATVDNQKVGINAQLSLDPGIVNTMGVLEPRPLDELQPANVLSAHALVFPFSTNDDSKRINFISTQSTHWILTKAVEQSRVRTGYERIVAHRSGRMFAGIAEQDGKITNIDEKSNLIEMTYEDGTVDVFRYGEQYTEFQGFHVSQDIKPVVELGQKLKKGEVVTYNTGYFTRDETTGQLDLTIGVLANVALLEYDTTLEDSTEISQRLSEKLTIRPTNTRIVTLSKKSIIHKAVSVGDEVLNTDSLMIFEEEPIEGTTVFNTDDETLALLSDLNKNTPTAKFNGKIVNIEAYYGCPISEMHPTLGSIVKSATDKKNRQNKIASKTERAEDFPPSGIMPSGSKYKGVTFDEDTVCLIFYIQEEIPHDKGDKLVFMNQLKCTCAGVFPKDITSESGVPIDAFFSCDAIGRRVVLSPILYGILARIMEHTESTAVDMYFN